MPITMQHESDNLYRVDVRGTLQKAELERCQTDLVLQMQRLGPVRLLFILDGFEGWAPGDNWRDLSFYVTHGQDIERIAIVGDERWRSEALMFVGADLRKAPVEFFSRGRGFGRACLADEVVACNTSGASRRWIWKSRSHHCDQRVDDMRSRFRPSRS